MLEVQGLKKTYASEGGSVEAVRGVSFQVQAGGFYTLLGSSGCGKTTILRCVVGLEQPDAGEIKLGVDLVFSNKRDINVSANKRGVGMVFQSYAIWPHMSVFDNIAFPLIYGKQKVGKREVRERVMRALELVQLTGMENRPAPFLSGGQQQRASLARALVHEPKILFLDEPLSNLDAKLRTEMRLELKELVKRIGITTMYVTHDQIEALSMSDRIAVMHDGVIVEEGTPREIYLSPRSAFTAHFIGQTNVLEGRLTGQNDKDGHALVETACGRLACDWPANVPLADSVLIGFRPESITVYPSRPQLDGNVIEGIIERTTFIGDAVECVVRAGDCLLRAKVDPFMELHPKATVYLCFSSSRCQPIALSGD